MKARFTIESVRLLLLLFLLGLLLVLADKANVALDSEKSHRLPPGADQHMLGMTDHHSSGVENDRGETC